MTTPAQINTGRAALIVNPCGCVVRAGVEQPQARIAFEDETHIVLRVPSHTYWASLLDTRHLAPAAFQVYEKIEEVQGWKSRTDMRRIGVRWLFDFPTMDRNPKPGKRDHEHWAS